MNKLKLHYIFYSIAVAILLISIYQYNLFSKTKNDINKTSFNANISLVDNITNNISKNLVKHTDDGIYYTLKNNIKLRKQLEGDLHLFNTIQYKYIYVLDRKNTNSHNFRFLLDGSNNSDDKSEFEEPYTPLDIKIWNKVYDTKKAHYFKHKDTLSLWITYLKPIIINDKVEAIIVIDFSIENHKVIMGVLSNLDHTFDLSIIFFIFIFVIIIIFAYLDRKREEEKDNIFKQLQLQNIDINNFNQTLQTKIDEEIFKNREKDKHLIEQSRLAQMGEMISMIAHQWRQPLAAISSTSAAINLKVTLDKLDNKTALELSNKISNYSQHLSSTIDDFRSFFKQNKQKMNTTYTELINSVLNIIESSLLNKTIIINKKLESTIVFQTYPNEIKQVLLNIIKNAEDILIENEIKNPSITIQTKDNILTISDNAGGIPEDILSKVFDPYFSTKLQKDGTGLGLYMSKTIIEEHCNGELTVSNDENGAVFKIII